MPCEVVGGYTSGEEHERATRVACELAALLRKGGKPLPRSISKEARDWITEHDEMDRERKEDEKQRREQKQLKAQALAKLSPEERRAIGVFE